MKKFDVLAIDDDRVLAEFIRAGFPTSRFSVRLGHCAQDAFNEIEKKKPDLMILDVVLPDLSGWRVLDRLKKDPRTARIPIILCTGKESTDDVEKSFQEGAQAYIMKPFKFDKLYKKVLAILDIEDLLSE